MCSRIVLITVKMVFKTETKSTIHPLAKTLVLRGFFFIPIVLGAKVEHCMHLVVMNY